MMQKVVKDGVRNILNVHFGPGIETANIVSDRQEILLANVEIIVFVDLDLVYWTDFSRRRMGFQHSIVRWNPTPMT